MYNLLNFYHFGTITFLMGIFISTVLSLRTDISKEKLEIAQKHLDILEETSKSKTWLKPFDVDMLSSNGLINSLLNHESRNLFLFANNESPFTDFKEKSVKEDAIVPKTVTYTQTCSNNVKNISSKSSSPSSIFVTRWLKMFLSKFPVVGSNDGNKVVSFLISSDELMVLRSFLENKTRILTTFDRVMSKILLKIEVDDEQSWISKNMPGYTPEQIFGCVLILVVLLIYMWKYPKLIAFILICLTIICWQWMSLYQEAIAKKQSHLESISFPEICRKHDLSLLENIRLWVTGFVSYQGNCEDYYKALMVDPFWEITPTLAVSAAVSKFFLYPLEVISETANNSVQKLFKGLSLPQTIILIIMLFFFCMMFFRYRLYIPFVGGFEPVYPKIQNQHKLPELTDKKESVPIPQITKIYIKNNASPLSDLIQTSKMIAESSNNQEIILYNQNHDILRNSQMKLDKHVKNSANTISKISSEDTNCDKNYAPVQESSSTSSIKSAFTEMTHNVMHDKEIASNILNNDEPYGQQKENSLNKSSSQNEENIIDFSIVNSDKPTIDDDRTMHLNEESSLDDSLLVNLSSLNLDNKIDQIEEKTILENVNSSIKTETTCDNKQNEDNEPHETLCSSVSSLSLASSNDDEFCDVSTFNHTLHSVEFAKNSK